MVQAQVKFITSHQQNQKTRQFFSSTQQRQRLDFVALLKRTLPLPPPSSTAAQSIHSKLVQQKLGKSSSVFHMYPLNIKNNHKGRRERRKQQQRKIGTNYE